MATRHLGQQALDEIAVSNPLLLAMVDGWMLRSYAYNSYLEWSHPDLPISVSVLPAAFEAHRFDLKLYDAPVVHIEGVVSDAQVVAMLNGLIAATPAD
jgi:hypothetical protein